MPDLPPDPQTDPQLPTRVTPTERLLTAAEFHRLAEVPPEIEWFANITNPPRLRKHHQRFHALHRILRPKEFRTVTRAHVIAWHDDLARRELDGSTIRNRLAALSSLFQYLCDKNAVADNLAIPVLAWRRAHTAEPGETVSGWHGRSHSTTVPKRGRGIRWAGIGGFDRHLA
jgi:hypothetical protein